jgi:hypothetical protein
MRRRPSIEVPEALRLARREIDRWRGRQCGRKRLPREFWAKAAHLAQVHGVNRTARTLGLKYASLRRHLETGPDAASGSVSAAPAFLELVPRRAPGPGLPCTIELEDGYGGTVRMHVPGATMADLAAFAVRLRSGRP